MLRPIKHFFATKRNVTKYMKISQLTVNNWIKDSKSPVFLEAEWYQIFSGKLDF